MSYGGRYGGNTGLGIAPAIIAAAIPVAVKLVGLVASLFGRKNPSAQQLATAEASMKRYIEGYAEAWAQGDRLRIAEIKGKLQYMATASNWPGYYHDYAKAALQTIADYDAQNPSPPQYAGPVIVAIETDSDKKRQTPLYAMPQSGVTKIGDVTITQHDGSRTTVPLLLLNPGVPSNVGAPGYGSGDKTYKAGVLGSAMPIFIGGAVLAVVAAVTDKRK